MNEEYEIKIENYGYINIYSVIRNIKIPDCLLGKIEANDFLMEEWKKNYEIIRKKYPETEEGYLNCGKIKLLGNPEIIRKRILEDRKNKRNKKKRNK